MAIFNMVQGKVPMTYRGTKTIALFHFENNAYSSVGLGFVSNITGYANGKFGQGVKITIGSISYSDPNLLAFRKNPFTVEYFEFKINNYGGLSFRNKNGYEIFKIDFKNDMVITYIGSEIGRHSYSSALLNNAFNHFSIAGDGGPDGSRHIAVYLNGKNIAYRAFDYNLEAVHSLHVGVNNNIIDELRVSNIYRYTTNFTPPTAPFAPD